ncbi:MFS transporter [Synechococcus sp. CBW1107]|uniref:MFS transporter n=1 Tax=Synechococcus sp. CBW1107 TaxID=2789857 RepID=UPI0018CEBB83|nr:MFS transporter [Synechococcus sp. CBW1107]QPN55494.1 MFS transporter [Synechococcus sp. CBW1107]
MSAAASQASITAYALGYGLSQLVWGPLSDRWGRRPTALTGLALFSLASLLLVAVSGFAPFLTMRLIQGIGAGCGTSVSRACLRDVFSDRLLTRAMSFVAMSYALALGLAPFLGGLIARVAPWRVDFLLLSLLGAATAGVLSRGLREPRRPAPTERRAGWGVGEIALGYGRLARDSRFLVPALIATFGTGLMVVYSAVSPFDFEKGLGFSPSQFGAISLSLSIPYLVGAAVLSRWVMGLGQERLLRGGLGAVLAGAALMLALGVTGRFDADSLLVPMLVVTLGAGLMVPIGLAMPMQAFPDQAGQASALTGFLQQEGSGLLVALAVGIPDTTQVPLAGALLALGVVLALLVRAYGRLAPSP